jgi:excisionase family DNA binding protein
MLSFCWQSLAVCVVGDVRRFTRKEMTMAVQLQQVTHEVLTLDEVAAYLRLPKETVERQAMRGQLPARRIEDTWRFLKTAIDDWLRSQDSRLILLQQAGALRDDDSLAELRAAIYAQRGRTEVEIEA